MATLMETIEWILDGEKANATVFNRPIRDLVQMMDDGLLGKGENSATFVEAITLDGDVQSGHFVYMDTDGLYKPATSLDNVIGQYVYVNDLHKIYLYGLAPFQGLEVGTTYYLDKDIPGAITNVIYNGAKEVGVALDATTLFVTGGGDGSGSGDSTEGTITSDAFVAEDGQTSVDLAYSIDHIFIYNNGILMPEANYEAITGNTITFTVPLKENDQIKVMSLGIASIANSGIPSETNFDANEGQTDFTITYISNQMQVYINGIKIRDTKYVATNGTSVVFNEQLNLNDWVQFLTYG